MSNERKNQLTAIMTLAWQFVKRNGFTLSEALKTAWANVKLHAAMKTAQAENPVHEFREKC